VRHFAEINQRFSRLTLEIMILKFAPVRQPVIVVKPVIQQKLRRVSRALVSALAPRLYLLTNAQHARRGGNARFQQAELVNVRFCFAWHGYLRFDEGEYTGINSGESAGNHAPHQIQIRRAKSSSSRRSAHSPVRRRDELPGPAQAALPG